MQGDEDRLRMHIAPMLDKYGQDIMQILEQDTTKFPFEYYAVKYMTFPGRPYAGFCRYAHHMHLDSARIDSDHAAQEYTRTLFSINVPLAERYRPEDTWRQQKTFFMKSICPALMRVSKPASSGSDWARIRVSKPVWILRKTVFLFAIAAKAGMLH